MSGRDPVLQPVAVAALRPTQMTIGFREVGEKRRQWRDREERKGPEFLGRHTIPVLKGPADRMYVIDHHHLARALQEEGVEQIAVNVVADLATLKKSEFWSFCDNHGWCHPYDAEGERCGFGDIPKSLDAMTDDPYRSLAGSLRRAGGYAKEVVPFTEFMWADFLRRRIGRKAVDKDFAAALVKALALGKSDAAQHLPGWCGPSDDD